MNNQRINLVTNRHEKYFYIHDPERFRLGGGAMGEVFEGRNADFPNIKVAIKRVYPQHAENLDIRRRARFEASLIIDHPNLIKMLGYSEFDTHKGPMFIISELVQGITIDKFVTTLGINNRTEIVSRMTCSILDALTCLHTLTPAIYHRDIKPSNIMVENGKSVRLMDLGIATMDGVNLKTLDGRMIGTYLYAPPEQIMGERSNINSTSDIYSLGVTFYELLADKNPFSGGNYIDIMEKQLKMELPYCELIPKSLFKVILKATEKKQSNRFQNALDFKEAIIKALDKKDVPDINWNTIIIISSTCLTLLLVAILLFSK